MIDHAHRKNLRRYPAFAFVVCLLLAYCAEELFGVADIIGAFVAGLIVAHRGLSMGALGQSMMTPIVIMVVGCAVLTPVLLKLVFGGHAEESAAQSALADRYHRAEHLEVVSDELLNRRTR